jgi:hypothetical protein
MTKLTIENDQYPPAFMRVKADKITLLEPIWCVFWYAVYALARLFLFGANLWCASGGRVEIPQKN